MLIFCLCGLSLNGDAESSERTACRTSVRRGLGRILRGLHLFWAALWVWDVLVQCAAYPVHSCLNERMVRSAGCLAVILQTTGADWLFSHPLTVLCILHFHSRHPHVTFILSCYVTFGWAMDFPVKSSAEAVLKLPFFFNDFSLEKIYWSPRWRLNL